MRTSGGSELTFMHGFAILSMHEQSSSDPVDDAPAETRSAGFGALSAGSAGASRQTEGAARLLAGGGALVALVSTALPWLRVGAAGSVKLYTGLEVPALAAAVILFSLLCLGGVFVAWLRSSRDARDVALLGAVGVVCVAGVLLVVVECASAIIPNGLLPALVRRYALDLRAGPGLWLALAGGALAAAALSGRLPAATPELSGRVEHGLLRRPVLALLALVALAAGFGVLRYSPWITATAVGDHYGVGGWALPWVGPLSLLAMLGLIAAAAAALAGRETTAALVAAGAGWVITLVAALTIITASTLADVRFADFAPARLRGDVPHLGPSGGATFAFALGLAAVAVAATLLATRTAGEES